MKTIPTVHELRKQGLRVAVCHRRFYYRYDSRTGKKQSVLLARFERDEDPKYSDYHLDALGGETVVTIIDSQEAEFTAFSTCSLQDRYKKRIGRMKALAQAYHEYLKLTCA